MEKKLREAAASGEAEEVRKILKKNPKIKVNEKEPGAEGSTALHRACEGGNEENVAMRLAHPDIDVNPKDTMFGETHLEQGADTAFFPLFGYCSRMLGSSSMSLVMMDTLHSMMLLGMEALR
jgi:ankyrin repeat protein